jgi:hypothetical protein
MEKKYYTVNEAEGECAHIGTLIASTSEELKNKLITACAEHLDANVVETSDIDIEQCLYGRILEVKVTLDCEVEFPISVTISETWLY